MAQRYRLVFRGKYLPGLSREDVHAGLAELFHVSLERVQSLLATLPAIIKHDVDIDAGNRYLEVLAENGLITHLEPLQEAAAPGNDAWDGVERRSGEDRRGKMVDRRANRRGSAIQPDRRQTRGRRKTDHE